MRLSSNDVLLCSPSVVHFGGYQVGTPVRQILSVINKGNAPVRYHIITPMSVHFRARCLTKKGALSPGMSDQIEIEFEPSEYRYYYDTVKLHVEGDENLVIPLHAYPVNNGAELPRRLDFGTCSVGEHKSTTLPLRCKVPLDFEYEIRVLRPSDAIHVSPLSGVLSAATQAELQVTFSPLRMVTEICEIELRLSEFNHTPVRCVITGSAAPGVVRDRLLQEREDDSGMTADELSQARNELKRMVTGGGAGGGDGYTRAMDAKRRPDRSLRETDRYHNFAGAGDTPAQANLISKVRAGNGCSV